MILPPSAAPATTWLLVTMWPWPVVDPAGAGAGAVGARDPQGHDAGRGAGRDVGDGAVRAGRGSRSGAGRRGAPVPERPRSASAPPRRPPTSPARSATATATPMSAPQPGPPGRPRLGRVRGGQRGVPRIGREPLGSASGTGCVAGVRSVGGVGRVDGVGVRIRRTERRWRGGPRCRTARRSAPRWPRPGPGSAGSRRSARVHRASRGRAGPTDSSRRVRARARWSWGGFCPLDEATRAVVTAPSRSAIGSSAGGPRRAPVVAPGLVVAGHGVDSARSPRRPTTTVRVNRTWAIDTGAAGAEWVPWRATRPGPWRWPARCAPARVSGRPSGSRRRRPTARPRRRRRRWRAGRCGGTGGAEGCSSASWSWPVGSRPRAEVGRERGAERQQATTAGRPASTAHRRGRCAAGAPGRPRGRRPGRRRGGGPTPTAGPAGRRPAAYSASSSPWHCTRMASVIRSPRRGGG